MKNLIISLLILVAAVSESMAQQGTITGTVTNRKGEAVYGAIVSVKDAPGVAVYTDRNGRYEIEALPGDIIVVSDDASGRREVEVVAGKDTDVAFTVWDEIVYLGGAARFGQRREEVVGAVATATPDDIMKSSEHSLTNTLFGNVLGLTTLQNGGGEWENAASFYVRGIKTNSDQNILVLVDGIERNIDFLTPDEVESVQVLKDAPALALYGYRGINGALLITTKKGKYNSQNVEFRYDKAFRQPQGLPKFSDSYTYALAMNEARDNDGLSPRYNKYELEAFRDGSMPYYYPNTDWVNEVMKDLGGSSTYNFSVYGGGDKARYYTMFNLQSDRGFFKDTDNPEGYSTQMKMSKANLRINLDVDISSTTKMEIKVLGILEEHNRPTTTHNDIIGLLYSVPSAAFPVKTENGEWGGNSTWAGMNPAAALRATGYTRNSLRTIYSDLKLSQDLGFITKGLSLSAAVGFDNSVNYRDIYTKGYTYADYQIIFDSNGVPSAPIIVKGGQESELSHSKQITGQSRRFDFTANLDYEFERGKNSLFSSLIYKHDHPVFTGQHNTLYRTSISGYAHYGYDKRFYADLALVASASNRLKKSIRWKMAPSAAVGWIMSNEGFMKDQNVVDFLKVRASAGVIHTDYVPWANYWVQQYGSGNGYNFFDGGNNPTWVSGLAEGTLSSMKVNTERAAKYNLGIDLSLLGKITFTTELFYERRSNIALSTLNKYSTVLGAYGAYESGGIVDSKGIEVGADYRDGRNGWIWELGGKFTFNRNKQIEIFETPQPYDYMKSTGHPYGQPFGYEVEGFYKDAADIAASPTNLLAEVQPGDFKYKDQNGDGFIDEMDITSIGHNVMCPEIYYSFNLGLEYKGVGISAVFQGAANYSVWMAVAGRDYPLIGNSNITDEYYNNRWTPQNPNAKYPRLTTTLNNNNNENNDVWLRDRSFLKLRTCELYYKFPKSWMTKIGMSNAKIYVRGMNLFSIDDLNGVNPEVTSAVYPTWRSYHVGLTFGF